LVAEALSKKEATGGGHQEGEEEGAGESGIRGGLGVLFVFLADREGEEARDR